MDTATAFNPTVAVLRDDEERYGKTLPPALKEAIRDDPTMIAPLARVYGADVLHDMYVNSQAFTPAQQKDFVELCAKLGDMGVKQRADTPIGGGVSITINIPSVDSATSQKSITIDQAPECLVDMSVGVENG